MFTVRYLHKNNNSECAFLLMYFKGYIFGLRKSPLEMALVHEFPSLLKKFHQKTHLIGRILTTTFC